MLKPTPTEAGHLRVWASHAGQKRHCFSLPVPPHAVRIRTLTASSACCRTTHPALKGDPCAACPAPPAASRAIAGAAMAPRSGAPRQRRRVPLGCLVPDDGEIGGIQQHHPAEHGHDLQGRGRGGGGAHTHPCLHRVQQPQRRATQSCTAASCPAAHPLPSSPGPPTMMVARLGPRVSWYCLKRPPWRYRRLARHTYTYSA